MHNVSGVASEVLLVHRHDVVDEDVAAQLRLVDQTNAVRQDVQQTGFACTRATQDVEGLARCGVA